MQLHVCGYIWLVSVLYDIVIAIAVALLLTHIELLCGGGGERL